MLNISLRDIYPPNAWERNIYATPMTTEKTPENSDLERSLNHPLNWVTNLMSIDEPSSKVSEAIK